MLSNGILVRGIKNSLDSLSFPCKTKLIKSLINLLTSTVRLQRQRRECIRYTFNSTTLGKYLPIFFTLFYEIKTSDASVTVNENHHTPLTNREVVSAGPLTSEKAIFIFEKFHGRIQKLRRLLFSLFSAQLSQEHSEKLNCAISILQQILITLKNRAYLCDRFCNAKD